MLQLPNCKSGRNKLAVLLIMVAATLPALVACGDGEQRASDFDITMYQGGGEIADQQTSLDGVLAKGKPVVLNFWAGQCPPCVAEMPELEVAWQFYRDDIVLLGVDVGPSFGLRSFEDGRNLLHQIGVTYPAGNSSSPGIARDFGMTVLPGTFFITPDGTVQDSWVGAIRPAQLNRRIDDLIEAAK